TTVRLALVDLRNYSVFIQNTLCVYARPVESASKQTPEITQFIEKQLANGLSMDEPMVTSRFVSTSKSCPYLLDDANPQGIVDFAQIVLMRTPTHISLLGFDRDESVGIFGEREIEILRLVLPHVRRAVTISDFLNVQAIEKARMADTLDALN